jgi:GST-like protein
MIDLYTWGTPNGRKVSIMLEEVGLPYRAYPVNIGAGEQFEAAFQEISPGGKVPAIVDRETGTTMMQSGAILLYLAEKTGQLLPEDKDARWQVMEWLMWQMGDFGPALGQAHHFLKFWRGAISSSTTIRWRTWRPGHGCRASSGTKWRSRIIPT